MRPAEPVGANTTHSEESVMTNLPIIFTAMVAALAIPTGAQAAASGTAAMDGAYLLFQKDEHQSVLNLEPGGTVSRISDQQNTVGYTSSLGSWTKTGPGTARASVVDFNNPDQVDGGPGPSMIHFDLTFADPVDGKYRNVSGSFSGEAFTAGENPMNPAQPPVRTFRADFEGTRITAE